ncbi:hypothetical protein [Arthrobacter sp. NicSoilC12]|uniref:hypothetical protein n=1 Tax=Arthrobacter sp. NicSoilC12 TaxID=2831001 RepID=UPI001CC70C05|nr:hypothetical protein [Arthrobacter sp. NicSoilC12]GIU57108.1 hypothetical protein NicSoilC12_28570 [Arthrobacter sp. NicSoilC12]
MIDRLVQTLRTAFKSRVVMAMAFCGTAAVLSGILCLVLRQPALAVLPLALFALMAVMAVSQLVSMRWLQETEARKAHTRNRELRELVRGLSAPAAKASAPAAKASSPAAERTKSAPTAAPTAGRAVGRLAAAVTDDRDRQAKILRYLGAPVTAPWGGRVVYSILGQELYRYLGDAHALEPLRPSTIAAQIANGRGAALVIDDSAFTGGIWFGADSAAGTLLANEILRAFAECRSQGVPAYFVRTRLEANIYTTDFEAASDVVFSERSSLAEWTEDYRFGLLASLEAFATMNKGALIGSP